MVRRTEKNVAHSFDAFRLALSALEPLVYDLFLVRLRTDNKDVEAQRMVIVQTLLKLIRYNKVRSTSRTSRDELFPVVLGVATVDSDCR